MRTRGFLSLDANEDVSISYQVSIYVYICLRESFFLIYIYICGCVYIYISISRISYEHLLCRGNTIAACTSDYDVRCFMQLRNLLYICIFGFT